MREKSEKKRSLFSFPKKKKKSHSFRALKKKKKKKERLIHQTTRNDPHTRHVFFCSTACAALVGVRTRAQKRRIGERCVGFDRE